MRLIANASRKGKRRWLAKQGGSLEADALSRDAQLSTCTLVNCLVVRLDMLDYRLET
jgi:hypothetical protein